MLLLSRIKLAALLWDRTSLRRDAGKSGRENIPELFCLLPRWHSRYLSAFMLCCTKSHGPVWMASNQYIPLMGRRVCTNIKEQQFIAPFIKKFCSLFYQEFFGEVSHQKSLKFNDLPQIFVELFPSLHQISG